jgi:drug/metabolite transporter (DMT)-like permease
MACIAAAFCYAVSSVVTRRCPPVDPFSYAAVTLLVGAIPLVPAMLLIEGVPSFTGLRPGLARLFLGLFPTALAALLRVSVIRSAGPVFMTFVNYQVPLWSVFFGWLVLSEDLPWRFFAALGLILFGVLISQWPSLRRIGLRIRRSGG